MPILTSEPAVFPEQLFESSPGDFAERRWHVLHTRPRQEKSLARDLHDDGVPFFLPLVTKKLRIRGRVVSSYHPLFGGYLFALVQNDEHHSVIATRRVARSLDVPDQDRLWSDLRQIHRLIATGAPVTPEQQLAPGKLVQILSGPLAGLRGVIARSASGNRFVVHVDFIQRGASVLLDDFALAACRLEE